MRNGTTARPLDWRSGLLLALWVAWTVIGVAAALALMATALESRPEPRPEPPLFSTDAELKRWMEHEDGRATRRLYGTTIRVRAAEVGR